MRIRVFLIRGVFWCGKSGNASNLLPTDPITASSALAGSSRTPKIEQPTPLPFNWLTSRTRSQELEPLVDDDWMTKLKLVISRLLSQCRE